MSLKSKPFYWLECDEPGCGNKSTDGDEYDAWSDESQAIDCAENAEWLIVGDQHYCDGHGAKHDPDLKEDCDGSSACDSLAHIEGCFSTNPDFKEASL